MFAGPYPYMQIPGMMQQAHPHGIFTPQHQQLAANQSIQAGLAQARRLPSPHQKLNGGPGDPTGGLLHHGQALGHYADPAALANATRNDESSDDEAASASAWAPAAHNQRQHDSAQMGGARNAPHQLSRPLDKILQFHGGAGEGQPSWMRRPVGSGEAHLDAAQSSGQLTLTSPLASAMAGGAMAGAHLRRNDLMALPMSSGPDSPRAGKGMEVMGMLSAAPNQSEANSAGEGDGSGRQPALWANIHLLCDLLGGPLGQVGTLTQDTSASQTKP